MIDFRYHLVSLVSVFLALAVGIVLGAGPLKGTIADTLSSSVEQLRGEAANLRSQRDTAQAAADNRDTFTAAVSPTLVGQQLVGGNVVVITLPGADTDAVKPLTRALTLAGAKMTGQIDIKDAWTEPGKAKDRADAAASIGASVTSTTAAQPASSPAALPGVQASGVQASGVPASGLAVTAPNATPTVSGADQTQSALSGLLSRALVTRSAGTVQLDATARTLLDGFRKAGLIGVTGDVAGLAGEAVVLAPPVEVAANQPNATSSSFDPTPGWAALAVGLDARSQGAVVVGPASSATSGGVLATIRGQQPVVKVVSTIDTGGTPMGDVTTVLALREQSLGGAGSYGFVGKVTAPLPTRSGATKP
jgi:Copper transport outer membrane protein, MctB